MASCWKMGRKAPRGVENDCRERQKNGRFSGHFFAFKFLQITILQ